MVGRMPVDGIGTGTYIGNGEASQDIICNFPPARIKIFDSDGNFAELIDSKVIAYQEVLVSGVYVMKRFELLNAIEILPLGFKVKHAALNANGKTYYWEVSP